MNAPAPVKLFLQEHRQAAGVSRDRAAEALGVKVYEIGKMERNPEYVVLTLYQVEELRKLANLYGIHPGDFLKHPSAERIADRLIRVTPIAEMLGVSPEMWIKVDENLNDLEIAKKLDRIIAMNMTPKRFNAFIRMGVSMARFQEVLDEEDDGEPSS